MPLRELDKLLAATISVGYALEYASDRLEMDADAIVPGLRALLVDDVLATGGTLATAAALVEQAGAEVVGAALIIEIRGACGALALATSCRIALYHYLRMIRIK